MMAEGRLSMLTANVIQLPSSHARPRRAKAPRGAFLSPEEILAVLRTAKGRGVRDWAMILLAYRHGLRASEVCGLRLPDVDLKDGALSVQRLKGSMKTVQPLYSHRGQPLLDEVTTLRAWLKVRPADGSDYLFTSRKGGRLDRTQFFRVFQAVAKAARRVAWREKAPARPKAFSRLPSRCWKCQSGVGQASPRASLDKFDYGVCRHHG